jgi:hypothetical protein
LDSSSSEEGYINRRDREREREYGVLEVRHEHAGLLQLADPLGVFLGAAMCAQLHFAKRMRERSTEKRERGIRFTTEGVAFPCIRVDDERVRVSRVLVRFLLQLKSTKIYNPFRLLL